VRHDSLSLCLVILVAWRFKIRSGHFIDGCGAAGKKIPAGNEKRIPAGDGDPFSLEGEKIPGSLA
jgi:hypothetical protein